ncbi:MAG TPA: type II toxin-antitoxin system VapC family toxin [Alphaproteobacteria bacterium]|nr:type II toxin-antitoxin system VapC family toxin [Alphaproteobacteria bacterium]
MARFREARATEVLLLDTHVWLWLMIGSSELSSAARATITEAAARGGLRLAAISVWETAMLAQRGRITLSKPIREWVEEALAAPGLVLEPLSPEVAVESCELPGRFHGDPADRLIAATARLTTARLVTRDRRLLDYAAQGHLAALPA